MVAPAAPAALHLLTPGSPAYALLKVGAIGSIFALRFALARRSRAQHEGDTVGPEPPAPPPRPRGTHPVSRKKKRRRRRG